MTLSNCNPITYNTEQLVSFLTTKFVVYGIFAIAMLSVIFLVTAFAQTKLLIDIGKHKFKKLDYISLFINIIVFCFLLMWYVILWDMYLVTTGANRITHYTWVDAILAPIGFLLSPLNNYILYFFALGTILLMYRTLYDDRLSKILRMVVMTGFVFCLVGVMFAYLPVFIETIVFKGDYCVGIVCPKNLKIEVCDYAKGK
ncbi:MAG: hypothetical protein U0525_00840 [Patescibacteria group bacterium]